MLIYVGLSTLMFAFLSLVWGRADVTNCVIKFVFFVFSLGGGYVFVNTMGLIK